MTVLLMRHEREEEEARERETNRLTPVQQLEGIARALKARPGKGA